MLSTAAGGRTTIRGAQAETAAQRYERYTRALNGRPLPAALLDLDALDANLERLVSTVRGSGKILRLATKSLRCVELLRYLLDPAMLNAQSERGYITMADRRLPGAALYLPRRS